MSSIRERIEKLEWIENSILVRKFGSNIHDIDLGETIETGVVNRLMGARELGVDYAVVVRGVIAVSWDKYGDRRWNPLRGVITTFDIATDDNDREQEEKNIYAFLAGDQDTIEKCKNGVKPLSQVGRR